MKGKKDFVNLHKLGISSMNHLNKGLIGENNSYLKVVQLSTKYYNVLSIKY